MRDGSRPKCRPFALQMDDGRKAILALRGPGSVPDSR